MSGGKWNYAQGRIQNELETIAEEDPDVMRRWPRVAQALKNLSACLYDIIKEMDWDLSGDSHIKDDKAWDAEALAILIRAIEGAEEGDAMTFILKRTKDGMYVARFGLGSDRLYTYDIRKAAEFPTAAAAAREARPDESIWYESKLKYRKGV